MPRKRKANHYLRGEICWCWFRVHRGTKHRKSTYQRYPVLAEQAALRIEDEFLSARQTTRE